jgi:hypothetical protein
MALSQDPRPRSHYLTETNGVLITTQGPPVTFVLTVVSNGRDASHEQFWIAESLDESAPKCDPTGLSACPFDTMIISHVHSGIRSDLNDGPGRQGASR